MERDGLWIDYIVYGGIDHNGDGGTDHNGERQIMDRLYSLWRY